MLKKGAARFARRAFFDGVGPSNFAFVCRGAGEKVGPLTAASTIDGTSIAILC